MFIFAYSLTGLSPFPGSTEQEVLQSTIQYRWQEVDGLSPDAKDFLSKILIRDQKWADVESSQLHFLEHFSLFISIKMSLCIVALFHRDD